MINKEEINRFYVKKIFFLLIITLISSCFFQSKISTVDKNTSKKERKKEFFAQNTLQTNYKGWWVYGEDQHIFKDEKTLKEYTLEFPHENKKELVDLYLAVCEMEYFPMECIISTYNQVEGVQKKDTLIVADFEILHIEGCGE